MLQLQSVSKHFGAIHAVNDISLSVEPGEVVGLDGRQWRRQVHPGQADCREFSTNGRGVLVDGRPAISTSPSRRAPRASRSSTRISRLPQSHRRAERVPGPRAQEGFWPFRVLNKQAMIDRSAELFDELKSETRPRDLVRKMSGGQRQAVAIARTRLSNAKLVLMDEPTAAISVRQVAEVLELIRRLKHQGVAVILISHRMPDVFAVSDRIIVMRRGPKVADKATTSTSPEEITGLITGAIRAA